MNFLQLKKKITVVVGAVAASMAISTPILGDDTDVFFGDTQPSNTLLVLDTSGSMNIRDICEGERSGTPTANFITVVRWADRAERPNVGFSFWDNKRLQWYRNTGSGRQYFNPPVLRHTVETDTHSPDFLVSYQDKNNRTKYTYANNFYCSVPYIKRLDSLKKAVKAFLNDLDGSARIGLMEFPAKTDDNYWTVGGNLLYPVSRIDLRTEVDGTETHKDAMIEVVDGLVPSGGTPLTYSIYNAANYFNGTYNDFTGRAGRSRKPAYDGETVPSPISDSVCDIGNNIVFLSDGEPNNVWRYHVRDSNNFTGERCAWSRTGESCARDVAEYIYDNELVAGDENSNVRTHTVGFALYNKLVATNYLKAVADSGGGEEIDDPNDSSKKIMTQFYEAEDSDALVKAFQSIVETDVELGSFVTPSIPLSQNNRLRSGDEVYLAMFKPDAKNNWRGNLKKYKLVNGVVNSVNASGNASGDAVDPDTGIFLTGAQSAWSDTSDGNYVFLGAAAAEFRPNVNKTFSNLGNKTLVNNVNRLKKNLPLTTAQREKLFGSGVDAATAKVYLDRYDKKRIDNFEYVIDPDVDPEAPGNTVKANIGRFGDPLHSKPQIVNYYKKQGGRTVVKNSTVFIGTNEGYLHAINPKNGKELWSFVPRQLLANTKDIVDNKLVGDGRPKTYGLDGSITPYSFDSNNDGMLDKHYLYVGMRRGGNYYYALDITNRGTPKLAFTIAKTGVDTTDTFSGEVYRTLDNLGQTWSKPVVSKMIRGGVEKAVLVFGGGYDEYYDKEENPINLTPATTDGRAIYIVDALDGQVYHQIGVSLSVIKNSIASDLSLIDRDNDGLLDHIYAADVGGRIYRVDVNHPANGTGNSSVQLSTIANVSKQKASRFYNKPDVVFAPYNGTVVAMIGIGSGHRPTPKATDYGDRFYMFFDQTVFPRTTPSTPLRTTNLLPVRDSFDVSMQDALEGSKSGWYIQLDNGEKVLANATTVFYRTLFTTFEPRKSAEADACSPIQSTNKLYGINPSNGSPLSISLFGEGDSLSDEHSDRYSETSYIGIAPNVSVLFPEDESIAILLGTETICVGDDCDLGQGKVKTVKWKEKE